MVTNVTHCEVKEGNLPMRPPRVVDSCGYAVGLVHVRTIVSHAHSHRSPYANFQGEGTYMPSGDISGDTTVCQHIMHMPEPRRMLS